VNGCSCIFPYLGRMPSAGSCPFLGRFHWELTVNQRCVFILRVYHLFPAERLACLLLQRPLLSLLPFYAHQPQKPTIAMAIRRQRLYLKIRVGCASLTTSRLIPDSLVRSLFAPSHSCHRPHVESTGTATNHAPTCIPPRDHDGHNKIVRAASLNRDVSALPPLFACMW
jgi:hypothetical protein